MSSIDETLGEYLAREWPDEAVKRKLVRVSHDDRLPSDLRTDYLQEIMARNDHETAFLALRDFLDEAQYATISIELGINTIHYASAPVEKIFGYTPNELIGQPLTILMPKKYQDPHTNALNQFAVTGKRSLDSWSDIPQRGLHKKGREFDIEMSLGLFKARGVTYVGASIRDVTEQSVQKKRNYEMRELLQQTTAMVLNHGVPIFTVDSQTGRFIDANKEARKVYGFSEQEFHAMKIADMYADESKDLAQFAVGNQLEFRHSATYKKKDGSAIAVDVSGQPIMNEQKWFYQIIATRRAL